MEDDNTDIESESEGEFDDDEETTETESVYSLEDEDDDDDDMEYIEDSDSDETMSLDSESSEADNEETWVQQVRHYQRTTDLLIAQDAFRLLVEEIMQDYVTQNEYLDIEDEAVEALQTAVEDFLVRVLAGAQLSAIERNGGPVEVTRARDMWNFLRMQMTPPF